MPVLPDSLPPFPGFRPEAFQFLRDLAANNDRGWFKPRKATFDDELYDPLALLVNDVAQRCRERAIPLTADPYRARYRPYRDVRFAKDKRPYNTHVAASLTRSGDRHDPGGLYIHIEPGNCFVAAGFWSPDRRLLQHLRNRIVDRAPQFLQLITTLESAGYEVTARETLKRMPRGFQSHAETALAPHLKRKGLIVVHQLADADLQDHAAPAAITSFAADALPALTFGWDADAQPDPD